MAHARNDGEDRGLGVGFLVDLIRSEADAMETLIPAAEDRQWLPSPVPKPRDDTHERATGGRSDPTADTALDPRRLAVRATLNRAHRALRDAAVALRGARLALDRAVARYDGEDA